MENVEFYRTEYPVKATQEKMVAGGLPKFKTLSLFIEVRYKRGLIL